MPQENKKIRNATPVSEYNIQFKSRLEKDLYQVLFNSGFNPEYEKVKFILVEGFRPSVPFYNRDKQKCFRQSCNKIRDITYTPDFTFTYKGMFIIIEVKGIENDVFPIKKKLFRKLLETYDKKCLFFEVRNKKELLQTIEIIKSYVTQTDQRTN